MRILTGLVALAAACGALAVWPARPAVGSTSARCPVTTRGSTRKPPVAFVRTGLPVPYVHTWLGSKAIWLRLPRAGTIPAQRDAHGGTISAKFPWWRAISGQLHASARPVDAGEPRLNAYVAPAADYGPAGFVPSFLHFSRPGCWRITGTLRGRSLSFVARVVVGPP